MLKGTISNKVLLLLNETKSRTLPNLLSYKSLAKKIRFAQVSCSFFSFPRDLGYISNMSQRSSTKSEELLDIGTDVKGTVHPKD